MSVIGFTGIDAVIGFTGIDAVNALSYLELAFFTRNHPDLVYLRTMIKFVIHGYTSFVCQSDETKNFINNMFRITYGFNNVFFQVAYYPTGQVSNEHYTMILTDVSAWLKFTEYYCKNVLIKRT